jgi:WD40 repeat protein
VVRVLGDPRFRLDGALLALHVDWDGTVWSVEEPGVLRNWTVDTGREHSHLALSEFEMCWAFSGDGRLVASAADDWSLWDAATGALLLTQPQTSWVNALALRNDGALVATGHDDGRVQLWDSRVGTVLRTWEHGAPIAALAFSADGATLAVAAEDRVISLWNVPHGFTQGRLTGHTDRVAALAWHPQGRFLASAGWDTTARMWDTANCEPFYLLNGQANQVSAVAFAPDGLLLATADSDQVVWVWEPFTGRPVHRLRGHTGDVHCLAFTPDNRRLLSGGADGCIILWDLDSGRNLFQDGAVAPAQVRVSLSPDGGQLAWVTGGRALHLWEEDDQQGISDSILLPSNANAVAHSPDGRWIATGLKDGQVQLWDRHARQLGPLLHEHKTCVSQVTFSDDGSLLATAGGEDGYVYIWTTSSFTPVMLIPEAAGGGEVSGVAFVPGRPLVITAGVDWLNLDGTDGWLALWDIAAPAPLDSVPHGATAVAVSPDGQFLAAALLTDSVGLYEVDSLRLVRELDGHHGQVTSLAFSHDGRLLVTGSDDGNVRLWDARTGEPRGVIDVDAQVRDLTLTPDGRSLYTANANTTCFLIDLATSLNVAPS